VLTVLVVVVVWTVVALVLAVAVGTMLRAGAHGPAAPGPSSPLIPSCPAPTSAAIRRGTRHRRSDPVASPIVCAHRRAPLASRRARAAATAR
jgi:hypothetical protein